MFTAQIETLTVLENGLHYSGLGIDNFFFYFVDSKVKCAAFSMKKTEFKTEVQLENRGIESNRAQADLCMNPAVL